MAQGHPQTPRQGSVCIDSALTKSSRRPCLTMASGLSFGPHGTGSVASGMSLVLPALRRQKQPKSSPAGIGAPPGKPGHTSHSQFSSEL